MMNRSNTFLPRRERGKRFHVTQPASGVVKLTVPSFVKVWKDRYKNTAATQWNLATDTVPDSLYVEGYAAGSGFITLTYTGANAACEDKVKIEVEKVEIIGTRHLLKIEVSGHDLLR